MIYPALTPREDTVLLMFAEGLTNAEIAAELHVAAESVKSHSRTLFEKLGARNRTHAVALAYHRGVLAIPARRDAA